LLGQYVVRIPATTAKEGKGINFGFTETDNKGAGIQGFEYASRKAMEECRLQLEALVWLCADAL
jgi:hypothetical protein